MTNTLQDRSTVAAVADRHIVIQKARTKQLSPDNKEIRNNNGANNPVIAALVDRKKNLEEYAICGGDLARDEAIQFSAALLRDGELQKNQRYRGTLIIHVS